MLILEIVWVYLEVVVGFAVRAHLAVFADLEREFLHCLHFLVFGNNRILHVFVGPKKDPTGSKNRSHQIPERHSPCVYARGQIGSQVRHKLYILTGSNESHVGKQTEQWIWKVYKGFEVYQLPW